MPLQTHALANTCPYKCMPLQTHALKNACLCKRKRMPLQTHALANTCPYKRMPLQKHAPTNACPCRHMPLQTHALTNACPCETNALTNACPCKHMPLKTHAFANSARMASSRTKILLFTPNINLLFNTKLYTMQCMQIFFVWTNIIILAPRICWNQSLWSMVNVNSITFVKTFAPFLRPGLQTFCIFLFNFRSVLNEFHQLVAHLKTIFGPFDGSFVTIHFPETVATRQQSILLYRHRTNFIILLDSIRKINWIKVKWKQRLSEMPLKPATLKI